MNAGRVGLIIWLIFVFAGTCDTIYRITSIDAQDQRPRMTAELRYTDATVISDPEFQGDSGIGVVLVSYRDPDKVDVKTRVLVAKSSGVKAGDNIAIEEAYYSGGPEAPIACIAAVPKKVIAGSEAR